MKKIYILSFILSCVALSAQHSLTFANSPAIGDVESYKDADTTGIGHGTSGAGQTWNYTNIVFSPTAAINTSTYIAMSGVPNSFMFPGATAGTDNGTGASYGVWQNNASSLTYIGTAEPTATNCVFYGNSMKYYNYPFTFGSSSTDTYSYSSGGNTSIGSLTVTGDGTGTLQLPSATYNNVLKVKMKANENVSGGFPYTLDYEIYMYYSAASKFYLLAIMEYTVNFGFGTSVGKSVSVNNALTTGIENLNKEIKFAVYPNPASGEIFINHNMAENPSVQIVNNLGQTVMNLDASSWKAGSAINTSALSQGVYYLKLKSKNDEQVQKLIIQ